MVAESQNLCKLFYLGSPIISFRDIVSCTTVFLSFPPYLIKFVQVILIFLLFFSLFPFSIFFFLCDMILTTYLYMKADHIINSFITTKSRSSLHVESMSMWFIDFYGNQRLSLINWDILAAVLV